MNRYIRTLFALLLACCMGADLVAAPDANLPLTRSAKKRTSRSSGCAPATAAVDLDINNVRTRIQNGGDMWWDLVGLPRYEIPRVTEAGQVRRHSMFAGALWIGGLENNNIKIAAMTYRQKGSDFFPGPLDTARASTEASECLRFDRIWKIEAEQIEAFRRDRTRLTDEIITWPAHGNTSIGQARFLAPFVDVGGDPFRYEPDEGDYPAILGDQCLFFIYNDKGNVHSETQGEPIGLEIHTMAFAMLTNDEINNMTFYKNTVINRARTSLDSTYFGQWADPDLGFAFDDYVGCDVPRSLGFCYNGNDFDPGAFGYGENPPSIGIDFFQGPLDEHGNEIGMSKFVYYDNDFSLKGNPETAPHYYNYLRGHWKNGACIKRGNDGFNCPGCPCTDYMFPDDPRAPLPAWNERTAGNRPADRRFLQTAGPFSLKPGARNEVTVGVVWARASTGGAIGSLNMLKLASDKAQQLYDNDFRLISGPPEPQVTLRELDQKIVLTITNAKEVESYFDSMRSGVSGGDEWIRYRFQGYQIYQLRSSEVTTAELADPDRARLVATVDVADGVTTLINQVFNPEFNFIENHVMAQGDDQGLRHTFEIRTDRFASGHDQMVNYKFYYFKVLAYANALESEATNQYLPNRISRQLITAVPHRPGSVFGGTTLGADFGSGVEITRLSGRGNGGLVLDLTRESEEEIVRNRRSLNPTYRAGRGPVDVRVYDPFHVVPGDYEVVMLDTLPTGNRDILPHEGSIWYIENKQTGERIYSDTFIGFPNEQVLIGADGQSWGLVLKATQDTSLGWPREVVNNGFLASSITYADSNKAWYMGIPDADPITEFGDNIPTPQNWIRSGRHSGSPYNALVHSAMYTHPRADAYFADPNNNFANIVGGTVAPSIIVARSGLVGGTRLSMGPMPQSVNTQSTPWSNINSVDIVFTPDREKWTKCVVIEMGEDAAANEGGVAKFGLRDHPSLLRDPDAQGRPRYHATEKGMGWFPGYAISIETGERLNIIYGEDSQKPGENGADMIWNPTSNIINPGAGSLDYQSRYLWGGKHWVYVMAPTHSNTAARTRTTIYDEGETYRGVLASGNTVARDFMFYNVMWVMGPAPMPGRPLTSFADGLIPTETRIRVRLAKPYQTFSHTASDTINASRPSYSFSTGQVAKIANLDAGKKALQDVNVVPNPYYATSRYETSQLDNRVRFTNLPPRVEINIYTIDGILVRKFRKDERGISNTPFLDWDLKNHAGIPIASGVYLIHVNGFELGEKVVKWFGILRPIDLDTF